MPKIKWGWNENCLHREFVQCVPIFIYVSKLLTLSLHFEQQKSDKERANLHAQKCDQMNNCWSTTTNSWINGKDNKLRLISENRNKYFAFDIETNFRSTKLKKKTLYNSAFVSFQVRLKAHFHHSTTQEIKKIGFQMGQKKSNLKCDTSVNFPQLQKQRRSSNWKLIAVCMSKRNFVTFFFRVASPFRNPFFDTHTYVKMDLDLYCGRLN